MFGFFVYAFYIRYYMAGVLYLAISSVNEIVVYAEGEKQLLSYVLACVYLCSFPVIGVIIMIMYYKHRYRPQDIEDSNMAEFWADIKLSNFGT